MGRNFQGGNKQKSYANKADGDRPDQPLRLVEHPGEKYAIVTKVLGGGMFEVKYIEEKTDDMNIDIDLDVDIDIDIDIDHERQKNIYKYSLAHIRGKMKGKQKRNNYVSLNSIIIIQIRDFETNAKNSDIIHVYNQNNTHLLPITLTHEN
tara:strand:+ start:285 stop:734 length:450 start_codon:yes stop_codon:yes gene_type:complete